jgi:hypothetical protein
VLYNKYLDTSKSHIRHNDLQSHQTLLGHINDDVQTITANMVQGWIREVNQNLDKIGCEEHLEESYT